MLTGTPELEVDGIGVFRVCPRAVVAQSGDNGLAIPPRYIVFLNI